MRSFVRQPGFHCRLQQNQCGKPFDGSLPICICIKHEITLSHSPDGENPTRVGGLEKLGRHVVETAESMLIFSTIGEDSQIELRRGVQEGPDFINSSISVEYHP